MIGIYKITNQLGQVYVGQSKRLEKRKNEHFVKNPKGHFKLRESIIKYGLENHNFEVIEVCEINHLNERERYWQDFYNVLENGLNCSLVATKSKDAFLSYETKERMSKSGRGKTQSIEHLKKRMFAKTKIIIDINTGVFYNNVDEVVALYNYKKSTLVEYLNTTKKNKTPFRYALIDGIQNYY